VVDESLIQNTIAAGCLTKQITRHVISLIGSTHEAGADAVVVTCSSIGPAVSIARRVFEFPILRIDEAMAEKAVSIASRIGVVATIRTTLEPTVALLREKAAELNRRIEIVECLCAGAFERVVAGDTETHDRIVSEALIGLGKKVDLIVLAQASMARVLDQLGAQTLAISVLSSPELAIQQARQILSQ
jgi:Asp/Glu/hydantoin racemase